MRQELQKTIEFFRSGLVNEYEFTVKFLTVACDALDWPTEEISAEPLDLNIEERKLLLARGNLLSDKKAFRAISGYRVPSSLYDSEETWAEKESEVRPKFRTVMNWLEEKRVVTTEPEAWGEGCCTSWD